LFVSLVNRVYRGLSRHVIGRFNSGLQKKQDEPYTNIKFKVRLLKKKMIEY